MPRKLPPFVHRERSRHGKVVFYFRRGKGERIRLPDLGSAEFDEAYRAALAGTPTPKPVTGAGTLAWLVQEYKRSAHFSGLAPSTRRMRDNILKGVVKAAGNVQYRSITRAHINQGIDRRKPHAGNTFRKVMSQLFRWAISVGYLDANPCDGANRNRIKSDGHHTWTMAEVEQFRARWPLGTRERLACDLLLFTGLRRSDVFRIGRQHVTDNGISIRTNKTSSTLHIPIWPELQRSIEAAPTGDLTFLATANGLPFSSSASFGNWFSKACKAAGVPGTAHGLRKAEATIAAENGATPHELMAMFTWKKLAMAEHYTRKADSKRLASAASERIANAFSRTLDTGAGKVTKTSTKTKVQ